MSGNERPANERPERTQIFYEIPPSPGGSYQYEREDGTIVHEDASGEWTLEEDGEVEDIVFSMSPLHLMKLRQRGLVEADGEDD